MRYNIYVRGRGWAFQLADSLNKRNKLNYLITSYPKFMARKYNLPNNKTKSIFFIDLLTRLLNIFQKYLKKIDINIIGVIFFLLIFIIFLDYKFQYHRTLAQIKKS